MTNDISKEKKWPTSVENNYTAAWANVERIEKPSNVSIPSELAVIEAKEWVEENKK
ncbi:MAG: DUF3787 domain-containing protein [Peptostreptococcales bacterium]